MKQTGQEVNEKVRTIKQVSDLTGISVRMLHYYDKIGLLKPSVITKAGYRLYDDQSLEILQQILFFKELDIPLKGMRAIIESPQYDKVRVLHEQKELLSLRRNRLNELIALIERKLKGGSTMSFREFNMSGYFNALEGFKKEHTDQVVRYYGSMEEFDKNLETLKSKELEIAKMAIKEFGSIEKFTDAMKNNLSNIPSIMDGIETIKENTEDYLAQTHQLTKCLTSDLSKDPSSEDVQVIIKKIDDMVKKHYNILQMDMGENYWGLMADLYLTKPEYTIVNDKKYGKGATKYMAEAFKFYSENTK